MQQDPFTPPKAAFTRSVPIRFSHCDPAGIVYFPHYFNMFNGLIEDWYTEELGYKYADALIVRNGKVRLTPEAFTFHPEHHGLS